MNGREPTATEQLRSLEDTYASLKAAYLALERELAEISNGFISQTATILRLERELAEARATNANNVGLLEVIEQQGVELEAEKRRRERAEADLDDAATAICEAMDVLGLAGVDEPMTIVDASRSRMEELDALAAERIENGRLREAFVTMERAANECERTLANVLREREDTDRRIEEMVEARDRASLRSEQAEAALAALREQRNVLTEIADHYAWCRQCGDGPDCPDMDRLKEDGLWARREP